MTIVEWQEAFKLAVKNRQYNIYNAVMIKALTATATDAEVFKELVNKHYAQLESGSISSSALTGCEHPESPRALWRMAKQVTDVVGQMSIITEDGDPVLTEGGGDINMESQNAES